MTCHVQTLLVLIKIEWVVRFNANAVASGDNRHMMIHFQKIWNASRICVSSLRRGHANLLCIVPILVYVMPKQTQV